MMDFRRLTMIAAIGVMIAAVATLVPSAQDRALAVTGADWNAGNIISDAEFFDGNSMTPAQVQAFLNEKGKSCVAGEMPCLKDYSTATPSRPHETGLCNALPAHSSRTAAQIIDDVATACGINEKVILVTLQKEASLVTRTKPTAVNYRAATGFGCPDFQACDTAYYGFFNQVYNLGRQMKRYTQNPTNFGYIKGRVNTILYNPVTTCGSSDVYIENQATANLYIYTPYQPNAAALANLYGEGDACSAYGNRNFWRYYNEWFGSSNPPSASLARTTADPTVYLISGTKKYPILDYGTLQRFSSLGPVSFTSSSYLDGLTTMHPASRFVRGPDQAIYFVGSGYRLRSPSCALLVDYGGGCSTTSYVDLDASQVARFSGGPDLTPLLAVAGGSTYLVQGGKLREIANSQSAQAAGYAGVWANTLTAEAIAGYAIGTPVVTGGTVVTEHGTPNTHLVAGGARYSIGDAYTWLSARTSGSLSPTSLHQLQHGGSFGGVVSTVTGSANYALTSTSRYGVPATWGYPAGRVVPAVPDGFLDTFSAGPSLTSNSLVTDSTGRIFLSSTTGLGYVPNWIVLAATGNDPANATMLNASELDALPKRESFLTPGRAYVAPSDGRVYLIDGLSTKHHIASWALIGALGVGQLQAATEAQLGSYSTSPQGLGYRHQCADQNYIATGGGIRKIDAGRASLLPAPYQALSSTTCAQLAKTPSVQAFVRTPDGAIWLFDTSGLRHVHTWGRLVELGGATVDWTPIDTSVAALLPKGAPA